MIYYLILGEVPAKRKLDFVEFDFSKTVMILRNAIYNEKKNTFYSIDRNKLILWKVDIPFDCENDKLKMLDNAFSTINIEKDLKGEKMLSEDKISKYLINFDNPPSSIHVLVQLPPPQKLPEKLEFRDPHPSGFSWDFQASDALKEKLKVEIHKHFKYWKAKQLDKTKIPQYFILAEDGEEKSRIAQELPKLLIECTNDIDLQDRFKSVLVFNLSFENGTKLFRVVETDSSHAISNRMLFQLLNQPNETWDDFKNRYNVTPAEVLRRIAKHRDQEFSDLTVIIILDGLQVAMDNPDDGKNKQFFFYDCISILGMLLLDGPFIITCCTTTISMPIHDFLASSQQKRVFLPITSLQPLKTDDGQIFTTK